MFEVLDYYKPQVCTSNVLKMLNLSINNYYVFSAHRHENIESEESFNFLIETINRVAEVHQKTVIVSTHPRTRKKIESCKSILNDNVQLLRPLGFLDYLSLQVNACCVLSDSGTISEEASILNFRALNIRESHERPEAMEEAAVMMTGLRCDRVLEAMELVRNQPIGSNARQGFMSAHEVSDYTVPNVSSKIVKIINSYVDYRQFK
jgi:UDP-N-acetylglucosamine 2-epimerase (non-hydrolysing)